MRLGMKVSTNTGCLMDYSDKLASHMVTPGFKQSATLAMSLVVSCGYPAWLVLPVHATVNTRYHLLYQWLIYCSWQSGVFDVHIHLLTITRLGVPSCCQIGFNFTWSALYEVLGQVG